MAIRFNTILVFDNAEKAGGFHAPRGPAAAFGAMSGDQRGRIEPSFQEGRPRIS
jgi:hypothetical protein